LDFRKKFSDYFVYAEFYGYRNAISANAEFISETYLKAVAKKFNEVMAQDRVQRTLRKLADF